MTNGYGYIVLLDHGNINNDDDDDNDDCDV